MSLPPRRPRARERVALRRNLSIIPPRRLTRHGYGCGGQLLIVSLVAVVTGILLASLLVQQAFGTLREMEQQDPRQSQTATAAKQSASTNQETLPPSSLTRPFTILLLGVDRRDDPSEPSRSDTLIVVHVNPVERWVSMLSIPRDSVVKIPQIETVQKINVAYTLGYQNATDLYGPNVEPAAAGGALAAETVEEFLGLPIDYIAQVDFVGFEQIIDSVGGVTVDVPRPLLDAEYPTENFGVERVYIPAGLQVLDGRTALRYARSRHADSDFGRSRRQQQVLRALLEEVRRKGLLEQATTLPGLAAALERTVSTTLPISDPRVLSGLVDLARHLAADQILQLSINTDEVALVSEQGSDLYWDEADIQQLVQRMLRGPIPTPTPTLVPSATTAPTDELPTASPEATNTSEPVESEPALVLVQNGTSITGLAARLSEFLAARGYALGEPSNALESYHHTQIIDYRDRPEERARLAQLLGIEEQYIEVRDDDEAPADIVVIIGDDFNEGLIQ